MWGFLAGLALGKALWGKAEQYKPTLPHVDNGVRVKIKYRYPELHDAQANGLVENKCVVVFHEFCQCFHETRFKGYENTCEILSKYTNSSVGVVGFSKTDHAAFLWVNNSFYATLWASDGKARLKFDNDYGSVDATLTLTDYAKKIWLNYSATKDDRDSDSLTESASPAVPAVKISSP